MNVELSGDRENLVRSLIQKGRFKSESEVVDRAFRLLEIHEGSEKDRVLRGIAEGIEDMRAGRGRPAEEVLREIGLEYDLLDEDA